MPIDLNGNIVSSTSINGSVFSNTIITDGLLIHLDAGNKNSYLGSGTTWTNLASNEFNATLNNSVGFTSTGGGMLTFNGSNQTATINVNSFIRNNTSYTFSTFFYLTISDGSAPFCLMTTPNNGDTNDGFWQHLNLGNYLWRTEDNVSGEFGGNVESPSLFASNNYYYLTVVVSTNSLKFYRNGILLNIISTNFSWSNIRTDNDAVLFIGKSYEDGYYLTGNIGNFQLYNRVLNSAEILANYYGQKSRFGL